MSSRTSGSTNSNPSVMLALERLRHASLLADKRDMLAEIKVSHIMRSLDYISFYRKVI